MITDNTAAGKRQKCSLRDYFSVKSSKTALQTKGSKAEPDTGPEIQSAADNITEAKSDTATAFDVTSESVEVCQASAKTVIAEETADDTGSVSQVEKINVSSDSLNIPECRTTTNEVNRCAINGLISGNVGSCLLFTQ